MLALFFGVYNRNITRMPMFMHGFFGPAAAHVASEAPPTQCQCPEQMVARALAQAHPPTHSHTHPHTPGTRTADSISIWMSSLFLGCPEGDRPVWHDGGATLSRIIN